MNELAKSILLVTFVISGFAIFVGMAICYFTMYKNTKSGQYFTFQNFMPYTSSTPFNETGNKARAIYNKLYLTFVVWGVLLYVSYVYFN